MKTNEMTKEYLDLIALSKKVYAAIVRVGDGYVVTCYNGFDVDNSGDELVAFNQVDTENAESAYNTIITRLCQEVKVSYICATDGNKSEFARSQGVKPFQVNRWIKLDCIWHNGKVYQPKT